MYENVKTKIYVGAHSKCIYWGKKSIFMTKAILWSVKMVNKRI